MSWNIRSDFYIKTVSIGTPVIVVQ